MTVSAASLYEVLAGFDADGGAELLREILRYSQNSDQWASVWVNEDDWDLFWNRTEPVICQIDNLPGGKPLLKSSFDQAQSKISIDDGNITFNSVKVVHSGQNLEAAEKSFTLTVDNLNDPPILEDVQDAIINEDASFSYQLTASDIDADVVSETLSYDAVSKPVWLNVSSSGLVTGTPGNEDVGAHDVTVRVTDSTGATDTKTFTLTVNNTNDVPEFTFTAPTSTDEDASFSYQLTASDIDADVVEETLTYDAVSAPVWLNVSSSGLVTGTPGNEDVGAHDVTVRVTDSAGTTDTKTFTLTVNNTNDAPAIKIGDTDGLLADAFDGSVFSHQLNVADIDFGDTHKYSVSSSEDISWLYLDDITGQLNGTPEDEHVGFYNLTFSVEDAEGASSSEVVGLTVNNVNDPVFVDADQSILFRSDIQNSYFISVSDEDLNDSYTFSSDNLVSWMSLDASTGELFGKPTRDDDGIYEINISVEDAGGLTDTKTVEVISTSFEYSILGSGDDIVIGDGDRDYISTGGGNDKVISGAGDDVVIVQGEGEVEVDTGIGDDRVVVEEGFLAHCL